MDISPDNKIFTLAADIVKNTSKNVFLTGKAGTGKTTFLHYIRKNTDKNVIVAAPTGVAAINAGGVTLHSLLQLPFEAYVPNLEGKKKLEFHLKLRKSKIEMLRELELLIIDEVSMLRADTLDVIDYMLKRYRNCQLPFGGVQILFIGDLFQLPPVVQQQEWEQLKHFYPSPFFFDALVLQDNMPIYIELKKIYRQSDQIFIDILNNIRHNRISSSDLEKLNKRYDPTFRLSENKGYVVLSTHNHKVDKINREELERLNTTAVSFMGEITGDFSDNSLPCDSNLTLKENAQIMFVKNDSGENKRFYNGKLARVKSIKDDKIIVIFDDNTQMEVVKETWKNIRYTLNADSGQIKEEEIGSYTQYPIRLAWAITIHKSQGLTFDQVVIDAGQAFAAGQVYVALSRCRSLDGIVLHSRITHENIRSDQVTLAFSNQQLDEQYLNQVLELEKPKYCADRLIKAFDWTPIVRCLHSFYELATTKQVSSKKDIQSLASDLYNKSLSDQKIAQNFIKELRVLLSNPDINKLRDRVGKAALYFHKEIQIHIVTPLEEHISSLKNASKVKAYLRKVSEIDSNLLSFLSKLRNIHYGNINLTAHIEFDPINTAGNIQTIAPKKGRTKGESKKITLSLFNEGKSIDSIAKERNLSRTTIEGHLSDFILTGELSVSKFIGNTELSYLVKKLTDIPSHTTLSEIKENLPDQYSYFDIKLVLNHLQWLKSENG